jgi:hypothetical protein
MGTSYRGAVFVAKGSKHVSDKGFVRKCSQDGERSSYLHCNKKRNIACQCTSLLQQLQMTATYFGYKVATIKLYISEV